MKEEEIYATKEELSEIRSMVEEIREMMKDKMSEVKEEVSEESELNEQIKEELSKPASEPITHSPEMEDKSKVFDIFYDNNPFEKTNNNVNYYLLSDKLNPKYIEELNNKIATGKYTLIFEYETYVQEDNRTEKYMFLKINK